MTSQTVYRKVVMFSMIAIAGIMLFSSSVICADLTIYTEESPNSHYMDKDGKITGYVYELVLEMQKKMGDTTPIQMVPWARGYNLATTKPNIALFSTTFTEERRSLFKWVGPVLEVEWVLYAKAGSGIKINSLDDAKIVKSIGTYRDDVREQFLKSHGFTNLDSVTEDELNLKKLIGNRISLWAASSDTAPLIAAKLGISLDSFEAVFKMDSNGLFIAFNKDTSDDIVNAWAKAYDDVRADGTMAAIYKKWNVNIPTYQIPAAP
ncbi:MAG: ABC transporter substrate-binding protein [Desulfamplus sp.]|nr:ABC transporter substrate-binding protein [Desulfamplus sp.]